MTDNEIIKALERCSKGTECKDCPYYAAATCKYVNFMASVALALISCQKEEIKRYKGVIKILENDVQTSKSEAVREFAEKLKESLSWRTEPIDDYDIDELVKEMVSEDDART